MIGIESQQQKILVRSKQNNKNKLTTNVIGVATFHPLPNCYYLNNFSPVEVVTTARFNHQIRKFKYLSADRSAGERSHPSSAVGLDFSTASLLVGLAEGILHIANEFWWISSHPCSWRSGQWNQEIFLLPSATANGKSVEVDP
jgi:hypothetical protein